MPDPMKPVQTVIWPETPAWRDAIDAVVSGHQRVAVRRNGEIVAVLVSPDDWERLRQQESLTDDWRANLAAIREAFADIPKEQRMRDVVAIVAEVRAERHGTLQPAGAC